MSSPLDGTRRKFLTLTAAALGTGSLSGNALAAPGESGPADPVRRSADAADASPTPAAPADWASYQYDAGNTGATAAPGPGDDAWVDWSEQVSDRRLFAPAVADGIAYVADVDETLTAFDLDDRETRWTVDLDGVEYAPAVADGVVYACGSTLRALDAATGEERWRAELDAVDSSSPTVADGTVYVTTSDANGQAVCRAFDATTGEESWRLRLPSGKDAPAPNSENVPPAVADGVAYFVDQETVYAVDAGTGDPAWQVSLDGIVDHAPTVADGTVYVCDGRVSALDADDGSVEWTAEPAPPEEVRLSQSPAVAGGTVVVADGRESRAWALDADDGAVRWEYAAGQSLSSPAVADDTVYFAGDERAVAVDLTGEERWSVPTRDLGNAWLAPAVADGTVYLGDSEGFLYALAESDDLRWRSDSVGALATGNGRVYVGGDDLTALAGGSGGAHWTARTGDLAAPPVAAAGNVYVATGVELIAFAADGRAQWQTQLQSQAVAGPVVADGTLYIATGEEHVVVRAFDADAGTHQWTYAGDCETISSVADIAVGNGQVYAICDGQVVALDADAGEERWTAGDGVRALAVGSSVYAGTEANEVVAHAPDGSERWRTSLDRGEAVEHLAASAVSGRHTAGKGTRGGSNAEKRPGDVYAVTTDDVDDGSSREWLVALDRDGVRWSFHPAFTPFGALTAPVVGNGTVVVGASDHRVYALDTRDGSERRRFETGGPVEHVTVGNRIYAASDAAYAFRWLTAE
ncbi:outer membrane protein assembly factor BamB family protein [Halomicrococcus sp. SG-WS-1]|uniref:outer membrane protein assembly factor BamB family protein n=1 Tax=Halomicrococcus sp. SG-WS-1 TaxID=3439057 RepID=UPI003F798E88